MLAYLNYCSTILAYLMFLSRLEHPCLWDRLVSHETSGDYYA